MLKNHSKTISFTGMKIEIIPFAAAIENHSVKNKTVIIIDVLRATSVMITALNNGAKEIIPVVTVYEAWKTALNFEKKNILVCGERDAKKVKGFDLGNSPLEFSIEKVNNKTIIHTTTNGTKALNACQGAKEILLAAFLNLDAIVQKVSGLDELVLVCSGTNGKFSLDDGMCAAMIIDELSKIKEIQTDDLGRTLLKAFRIENGNLAELLKDCFHLNYLLEKGYEKDVKYCLQKNSHNIVPHFNNQIITISGD